MEEKTKEELLSEIMTLKDNYNDVVFQLKDCKAELKREREK